MSQGRLLALAAAGVVAGLGIAVVASPWSPAPSPAPQVQLTATPSSALTATLGEATGESSQREVVMTEAQLNQQLTQHLQQNQSSVPFRDAQVRLRRDGRVAVRGVTQLAGREAEVQAIVKVDARQGTLDLEIESAQAGNVPVPQVVAQELAERAALAAGLSGLKGNALPDGIEALRVEEGRLVITRRP